MPVGGASSMRHTMVQTRPHSGAHHRQTLRVPDRLRDTVSYFGADAVTFPTDETSNSNKEQRDQMMRNLMSGHSNTYSHTSIDKLRIALEDCRRREETAPEWRTLWTFMRTMHFCTELVREPFDELPEADRLYIDLDTCRDRRRAYVWTMEDGTTVLPVFTLEEYIGHYFQRCKVFESQWFPIPRNGKCFNEYKTMDFPVIAHGGIHHMARLATASAGQRPVLICVNPCQPACKFLTYPEMIEVAEAAKKAKPQYVRNEGVEQSFGHTANRGGLRERIELAKEEVAVWRHSTALHKVFDATKWSGRRVDPRHLPPPPTVATDGSPLVRVPDVAAAELKLLVFDFLDVTAVHAAEVRRPDNTLLLRVTAVTQVADGDAAPTPVERVRERLAVWSFLTEADSDTEIAVVAPTTDGWRAPTVGEDGVIAASRVYDASTAGMLRGTRVEVRKSVRELLDYDSNFEL